MNRQRLSPTAARAQRIAGLFFVCIFSAWAFEPRAVSAAQAPTLRQDAGENAPGPVVSVEPAGTPIQPPTPAPPELPPENGEGAPKYPPLPPNVQVVRFIAPEGVTLQVLAPSPDPVPQGDGGGVATLGLKVGVAYRMRIANIPERPGQELYPLVEIVGHLHRPLSIDPGKYPIRITWTLEDLLESLDKGRLVTQVIYLENPDFAVPMSVNKEEIPRHTITPVEDPLKVAIGLGRVVAIVRLGSRMPSVEEVNGENGASFIELASSRCPFLIKDGKDHCGLTCGPAVACAPEPAKPSMPKDEYLCDGGDFKNQAFFTQNRTATGVEPRDAVIGFVEPKGARILPTNIVCIYAPRFAMVRNSVGANENIKIEPLLENDLTQRQDLLRYRVPPQRLTQNQAAELNRHRSRPSEAAARVKTTSTAQIRILQGYDIVTQSASHTKVEKVLIQKERRAAKQFINKQRAIAIKTLEIAVLTGIVEGASETTMKWKPQELDGVELPPKRPGMGVFKRVSVTEAEPGDEVEYTIYYRNLGNTTIRAASILDSLLPRLEYVDGSAMGPKGTVFTLRPNDAGSSELRWDLADDLIPGAEGYVSFKAKVR